MNYSPHIAYYCFNKHCNGSIYQRDVVPLNLPFNLDTITTEHFCDRCNGKLVSLIDIEVRQVLTVSYCH